MSDSQHLALGLIFVILAVRLLLPDNSGHSKLIDIIAAAFKLSGSSTPSLADNLKAQGKLATPTGSYEANIPGLGTVNPTLDFAFGPGGSDLSSAPPLSAQGQADLQTYLKGLLNKIPLPGSKP